MGLQHGPLSRATAATSTHRSRLRSARSAQAARRADAHQVEAEVAVGQLLGDGVAWVLESSFRNGVVVIGWGCSGWGAGLERNCSVR